MDFLVALAPTLGNIIAGLAGLAITYLTAIVAKKTKNKYILDLVNQAGSLAVGVVATLNQTFVADLKKAAVDGKLTRDEANKAANAAIAKLKAQLGNKVIMELQRHFGSASALNDFLLDQIEAAVGKKG